MTRHGSEAERKSQIMRAARAVFIEKGFMSARMQDIARRAGLSKGALYFYFSSKRELFYALVEEEQRVTLSFLSIAAGDMRPAGLKLLDLGTQYLDYFAGMKSPPRFFLLMTEMAIRDEEIRDRVQDIHERFIAELAAIVRQGQEAGEFGPMDPVAVAQLLKAFIDGLAGQSAVGIRPDVQRLSTDGIRLIFEGLGLSSAAATEPPGNALEAG
ncbi:MAG: TetR/AcrR family transcriptional regulator [Alphaproteobacteria bacterium]|nr:TetR/AcrR family transcriptional regulator [Alphaproteobacteria bacterium]